MDRDDTGGINENTPGKSTSTFCECRGTLNIAARPIPFGQCGYGRAIAHSTACTAADRDLPKLILPVGAGLQCGDAVRQRQVIFLRRCGGRDWHPVPPNTIAFASVGHRSSIGAGRNLLLTICIPREGEHDSSHVAQICILCVRAYTIDPKTSNFIAVVRWDILRISTDGI